MDCVEIRKKIANYLPDEIVCIVFTINNSGSAFVLAKHKDIVGSHESMHISSEDDLYEIANRLQNKVLNNFYVKTKKQMKTLEQKLRGAFEQVEVVDKGTSSSGRELHSSIGVMYRVHKDGVIVDFDAARDCNIEGQELNDLILGIESRIKQLKDSNEHSSSN